MADSEHISHGLTRRELLKRLGAAGTGVALSGSLAGCEWMWRRQEVIDVETWYQGVCRFCGTGCGVQIGTAEGQIVDVRGDRDAHNRGRLCIKGIMNREILYVEDRLLRPLIRHNGELVEAEWDEAMELVAARFREAIDERGPDSVAYYGSGQLFTEESYTASKLFKAGIGTNNVDGNPRLCMASPAAAYTNVFGADEPMGCYEDIDHATCFFLEGANMAACHPVLWERVLDRKRTRPETFIIAVDPRRTRTVEHADLHLPVTPGTDVALLNAMMYEFFRRGAIDEEMLAEHLNFQQEGSPVDVETLRAHLEDYAPDEVAPMCGVSADAIREAAWRFADSSATMSFWTMGINQQVQGVAANELVMAMHLVTGHIGRPGATPFSLTGQPNAGGGVRDTGALSHTLPAGRRIVNEEHRREMEAHWGVPEGTISPEPGYDAVSLFRAIEQGDVACCLVMATNPLQSLPNVNRYREGVENTFLVVADSVHPTETTQFADVVLPAAMWTEKGGVFSQSERRYHYVPKIVEPPGEARSDLEILVEFADRLGYGEVLPNRTPEAIWEEWRHISEDTYYNFMGITYERMIAQPGLLWPCPDEDHPGTCRRYVPGEDPLTNADGRLDFYGHPDGRAIVFLHDQEEVAEATSEEYPFILNTGRVLEHWHTETITRRVDQLRDVATDFLQIHPSDARQYGIEDGDPVRVENPRGAETFRALLTTDVRQGSVFATFHNARHLVNRATIDEVDPTSRQPNFKRAAVRISPDTDALT